MILPKFVVDFIQAWLFVRQPKTSGLPIVIKGKVYQIGFPTARRCRELERLVELPDFEQYAELIAQIQAIEMLISESDVGSGGIEHYRKKLKEVEDKVEQWKEKQKDYHKAVLSLSRSERGYDVWDVLLEGGLDKSVPREKMCEALLELPDLLLLDAINFFLAWRKQISVSIQQKSLYLMQKEKKSWSG